MYLPSPVSRLTPAFPSESHLLISLCCPHILLPVCHCDIPHIMLPVTLSQFIAQPSSCWAGKHFGIRHYFFSFFFFVGGGDPKSSMIGSWKCLLSEIILFSGQIFPFFVADSRIYGTKKFLGQGSNLHHSSNPSAAVTEPDP